MIEFAWLLTYLPTVAKTSERFLTKSTKNKNNTRCPRPAIQRIQRRIHSSRNMVLTNTTGEYKAEDQMQRDFKSVFGQKERQCGVHPGRLLTLCEKLDLKIKATNANLTIQEMKKRQYVKENTSFLAKVKLTC